MNNQLIMLADALLSCRGQAGSVFLYPHVSVDGDAIGSALALLLALEQLEIKARLPLDERIPPKLDFLPALSRIEPYEPSPDADAAGLAGGQQIIGLAIDCAAADRMGRRGLLFKQAPQIFALDHHIAQEPVPPEFIVDPSAAAVGELVYDLIACLGNLTGRTLFNDDIATLLMAAIISDTGGFVYSNTSIRTFQTAAGLMGYPLDLRYITYRLFDRTSQERLRLMGRVFSEARFSCGDRVVLAAVDQQMLDACRASDYDLDGIIAYLKNVAGVDAAFLIRSQADGLLRVNIRSSERFDAAAFAARYGGGGHARAAGMHLSGLTLDEAAQKIAQEAGEQL
ncbi:MAG: DHH family phosphoesterase [Clostridiaceae bacterium]|nr:DHH family phosphoesterase [Clostridiaceae bacterium]